ncbi:hypothetical protein ABFS83_02G051600 [Erythranthe nasuta]
MIISIVSPVIIIIIIIPYASPLTFNFTKFSPNDLDIHYERSAYAANNVIQLTTNQRDSSPFASIGRATYSTPLHLWDKASNQLTDFSTNFSFVINSLNKAKYGDGISFFLAPSGSKIPQGATKGGAMGLTVDNDTLNSTDNPFVAVEFDIYSNEWDPPNEHVGIDVNSMRSVANRTWWSGVSIMQGLKHTAWVNYDSGSKNLSVVFSGFRNGSYVRQRVSQTVDLREYLPEFVTFGFSASTGNASALHSILSWRFTSNLDLEIVQGSVTNTGIVSVGPTSTISVSSKNNTGLVVGLSIGGSLLLLGLIVVVVFWKKRINRLKKNEGDEFVDIIMDDDEFERGSGPKKFSYDELAQATNKFSEQDKLGEGGFGGVYKGFLDSIKSNVAVKRISKGSKQGIKEYASEVKIISRLRHRNLVQLLGWCHEKKELLLVYELMPNGSLDTHLFGGTSKKSSLNWDIRFKIAQGLASALLYLHEEWIQCVVHRDIKSSNVMLDSDYNAKLGDFGLARLVDHEKGDQTTVLAGTMGYMAPECVVTGKANKETDVYSFGVVALEIASGKRPIGNGHVEGLVEWAWGLYGKGKVLEVSDPMLLICDRLNVKELRQLIVVGLWCVHPDSSARPSIGQVVRVLRFECELPVLPLRMPVPIYCTPALDMYASFPKGTFSFVGSEKTESSSKFTASSSSGASSASLLY